MNTKLRKNAKNDFEKGFYKLINNAVLGRSIMNVRSHRDIKLVTNNKKRCKLASKPNYHTKKQFSENFLAMEMKKAKTKMNVPVYISFTILEVSKTVMWKFFYDYLKPKYGDKIEFCYTDTDSFILYIKTEEFYEDIADDVEELFEISNNSSTSSAISSSTKKVLGKFKDELKGKIMTKFAGLRSKTYAYLIDDFKEKKKNKAVKKCAVKTELKFNYYKDCLFNNNVILKSQQRFESELHNVYTKEVNKIALSSNDDKRV